MTLITQSIYVPRRLDWPGSGTKLAADVDRAIRQTAGGREVVNVTLAPITTEATGGEECPTAGVLVITVLRETS